jgi:hypothetical protein
MEPGGTQFGFRRNPAKIQEIFGFGLNGAWRNPIWVPQEPNRNNGNMWFGVEWNLAEPNLGSAGTYQQCRKYVVLG